MWLYLSRNVENIRAVAGGPKPLDAELGNALKDYKTSFHLIPLPKDSNYGPVRTSPNLTGQHEDQPGKGWKGKKGKGKGKAAGSNAAPRGYIGCVGKDAKNRSICFDWNIGECSHAAAGAACRKGRHVCLKAGCFKPHQYHKAHAEEAKQKKESLQQDELHGSLFDKSQALILELFCGSEKVTATFKRNGFTKSLAIDKHKCKGAKASILTLDLTDENSQLMVLDWIRHPNTLAVFLAPPCGTCSLARFIPIADDENAPKPLRTATEPDGILGLEGPDKLRVSQANILHASVAECLGLCTILHKPCMVENPKNSIFWLTSPWRDLQCHDSLFYMAHQACAYGSKRPKWTLLCANFQEVLLINGVCDGKRSHEPWGVTKLGNKRVFATALEVHYPDALCQAIFQSFMLHLTDSFQFADSPFLSNVHFQAATGVQPRGAKLKPLFSPFSDIFVTLCDKQLNVLWPPSCPFLQHAELFHSVQVGVVMESMKSTRGVSKLVASTA